MKYAFNYGRMSPPTKGHEKLVSRMSNENDEVYIFLSPSFDKKKNLIPFDGKVDLARDAFRDYENVEIMTTKGTIIDACKAMELIADSEDEVTLYVGHDRFESIEKMLDRCNGKDFDIKNLTVKEVERDDDDISATKVRDAVFHNDFNYFKSNTNYSDPKEFFAIIKAYLGTIEMGESRVYDAYYDNEEEFESTETHIKDFTYEAFTGINGVDCFIDKLAEIIKDKNIRALLGQDCEELDAQLDDLVLSRDALVFEGFDKLYNKICKNIDLCDFSSKLDIGDYNEFYYIDENELISLLIKYCKHYDNIDLNEYLKDYDFVSWLCLIINGVLYVRYIMNQRPSYIEKPEEGISFDGKVAQVNVNTDDTLLDSDGNEIVANDEEEFDNYDDEEDGDEELKEGGSKNELNPEKTGNALEDNIDGIGDKFIAVMTNELGIPNVDLGNTNPKADMNNGGFFRKVDARTDKKTKLCVKKGSKAFNSLSAAADNSTKVTEAVQVTKKSDMFAIDMNDQDTKKWPILRVKISDASEEPPAGLKLNNWTSFQETVTAAILSLQLDGKISTYDDIFCTLTNSKYRGNTPGENVGKNCFTDFIELLDIDNIFKSNTNEDIAEFFKSNEKVGYNKNKQDFIAKDGWGRNWCLLANFRNKISSVLPNMKPKYIAIASLLNNNKEFEIDGIFGGIRMNKQKDFWDKSDIYFVSDDKIAKDAFKDYISLQSKDEFNNNIKQKLKAKQKENSDMSVEELRKIAEAEEIRRIKEIGLDNFNNGNFFGVSLKQISAEYDLETFNTYSDDDNIPKVTSDCFDEPYIELETKPHFKLDKKSGNKIPVFEVVDGNKVQKIVNGKPKYEIATSSVFNILINNKFKDLNVLRADKLCMNIRSFNSAGNFGIDFTANIIDGLDKNNNTKYKSAPTLGKGVNNFNDIYGAGSFKSFGFSNEAIEATVEENEEKGEDKVPECLANFEEFIKEQGPELFCSFICSALNLRREGSTMPSAMPYVLLH